MPKAAAKKQKAGTIAVGAVAKVAEPIHLTVVQDIATPHNNVLLQALHNRGDVVLDVWYCQPTAAQYGFTTDLINAVVPAKFYSATRPDWAFLRHILGLPHSHRLLVVGWMNPSTKILLFLLTLNRRTFGMWFDDPADGVVRSPLKTMLREMFYRVLRASNAHVFAVGRRCMEFFGQRGFAPSRLTNLPILVDLPDLAPLVAQKAALRETYGVPAGGVLLVCGSRLVREKGFDLTISALAQVPAKQRAKMRLVIVGKGPEKETLERLIATHQLHDQVVLQEWLAFPEFQALIAASEAFLHPCRFDAWGGTIFAHALGVPVLGSTSAGSAYDRIMHGENGWLYDPENTLELAALMGNLFDLTATQKAKLGEAARATAEAWAPARGADILLGGLSQ